LKHQLRLLLTLQNFQATQFIVVA